MISYKKKLKTTLNLVEDYHNNIDTIVDSKTILTSMENYTKEEMDTLFQDKKSILLIFDALATRIEERHSMHSGRIRMMFEGYLNELFDYTKENNFPFNAAIILENINYMSLLNLNNKVNPPAHSRLNHYVNGCSEEHGKAIHNDYLKIAINDNLKTIIKKYNYKLLGFDIIHFNTNNKLLNF
jgi:hypothetical protein